MIGTVVSEAFGHPLIAGSFIGGYAMAVLAPVPYLSRGILDLWAKFGSKIKSIFSKVETKVDTVETKIESGVTSSVTSAVDSTTTTAK